MLRIGLFLLTNIAILAVLSITMRVLGLEPYLTANGLNYTSLLLFAAAFGMGGSFISLAISKWMAKKTMGVKVIETPSNNVEQWLIDTVRRQSEMANIGMPEVGIFESPQMNAFATGMKKNAALVAVSRGLLDNMNKNEVEAVLGHEIAHIANGDMITLSLIQGVVNTFVIFFARIVGTFVDRVIFKNEEGRGMGFWVATIAAEIVLGILASTIVMWYSRRREFYADAGGANYSSRQNMISALQKLQQQTQKDLPDQLAAFGISGGVSSGMKRLFMSHPPLEERIAALQNASLDTDVSDNRTRSIN